MAIHEIQISHTEKFVRQCMCGDWELRTVADNSQLMVVPPVSILYSVLEMLAIHIEYFEVCQASEKVSVETTLQMLKEGKSVLASAILSNQARIKEGN